MVHFPGQEKEPLLQQNMKASSFGKANLLWHQIFQPMAVRALQTCGQARTVSTTIYSSSQRQLRQYPAEYGEKGVDAAIKIAVTCNDARDPCMCLIMP